MNFRSTIVLLLLAGGLGGFWYFYEVKGRDARDKAKEDAKLVFPDLKDQSPDEVALRAPSRDEIFLRRDGEHWRIVKPITYPAEASSASALVDQLKTLKKEETVVEKDADLREFGLDKPSGTVTFRPSSGTPKVLFFGSDNPGQQYSYAMIDGEPAVFMVQKYAKTGILKELKELRDKSFWTFNPSDVLKLKSGFGKGLSLQQDKDGLWNLTAPFREKGNQEEIKSWLTQLNNLRIDDFHDEKGANPSAYGLDAPDGRIELTLSGLARPLVLERSSKVRDNKGRYYRVSGKPLIFSMAEFANTTLEKKAEDLADKLAFGFKSYEVERFSAEFKGGKALKAVKKDGKWSWDPAPDDKDKKEDFDFYGFINDLGSAQLKSRLPSSSKPASPELDLTLYGEKDAVLEKITVGGKGKQAGSVVAFSQSKSQALEVADSLFAKIPK